MFAYNDIETIPVQDPAKIAALRAEIDAEAQAIEAPSTYKDPAKIAAYIADKRRNLAKAFDDRYRKTSFDALHGEIFCIAAAADQGPPLVWSRGADYQDPASEIGVLLGFFEWIGQDPFLRRRVTHVAHNGNSFDFPFIYRRAVIRRVPVPENLPRPTQIRAWGGGPTDDTMIMWTGDPRNHIKLDRLATALGLQGKGDIDGSMVWDYVRTGRGEEVAAYCLDDVRMLRQVHRRLQLFDLPAVDAAPDNAKWRKPLSWPSASWDARGAVATGNG